MVVYNTNPALLHRHANAGKRKMLLLTRQHQGPKSATSIKAPSYKKSSQDEWCECTQGCSQASRQTGCELTPMTAACHELEGVVASPDALGKAVILPKVRCSRINNASLYIAPFSPNLFSPNLFSVAIRKLYLRQTFVSAKCVHRTLGFAK